MRARHQPRPNRLSSRRFRRRRFALGAVLAAVAVVAGVSFAGAADPSLDDKIDSAQSQVDRLSGKVEAQSTDVAQLQADAREAGARAMELEAEVETTQERSRALADDLAAAEDQLEEVQARYKRALGVLSDRLVDIYKGGKPDALTVILQSDGFDDLETRAQYLDALNEADQRIADRVKALRDEVESRYEEVADLKARIDEEARRLEDARSEFASAQASAEEQASALGEVLAANRSELDGAEGQLADLEAQQQEQQSDSGSAYLGGPYSIPTYIVMCESGGNYHALNPSSGAGGAYQILPSTWAAYGGKGEPQNASKAEQDRIAAEIWADSGPSAWACA